MPLPTAHEIALGYGLCNCGVEYTSRNMTAPDCPLHAFAIEEAMEDYARQVAVNYAHHLLQKLVPSLTPEPNAQAFDVFDKYIEDNQPKPKPEDGRIICDRCNGSGEGAIPEHPCSKCDGSGELELCYECGDAPVYSDKLCNKCYYES